MEKENVWMEEAQMLAAQCWCDKETENYIMDPILCKAVAKRIAVWMETAAQNQRNADYYRGIVVECGKAIGKQAYIADDGSISDSVLCDKVADLVAKLVEANPGGAPN